MTFQVLEVALELVAALRTPIAAIAAKDVDLARQLRRAASSVPLNIGEGNQRCGGDRHCRENRSRQRLARLSA